MFESSLSLHNRCLFVCKYSRLLMFKMFCAKVED